MKVEIARKLEIGDQLIWKPDGARGTVTDKGYAAITITWEDGQAGIFQFEHPETPWKNIKEFEG